MTCFLASTPILNPDSSPVDPWPIFRISNSLLVCANMIEDNEIVDSSTSSLFILRACVDSVSLTI